jgi:hypothetical protein
VTRKRNAVIHPSRKRAKFSFEEWFEYWRLSMYYLQLACSGT